MLPWGIYINNPYKQENILKKYSEIFKNINHSFGDYYF